MSKKRSIPAFIAQEVSAKKEIAIIGAGPAGLYAALRAIEAGFKPIVFERGKDVRARRRDLAIINKEHTVNPESNYCFGEGGAGTYSDGKLYTRSKKRGNVLKAIAVVCTFWRRSRHTSRCPPAHWHQQAPKNYHRHERGHYCRRRAGAF